MKIKTLRKMYYVQDGDDYLEVFQDTSENWYKRQADGTVIPISDPGAAKQTGQDWSTHYSNTTAEYVSTRITHELSTGNLELEYALLAGLQIGIPLATPLLKEEWDLELKYKLLNIEGVREIESWESSLSSDGNYNVTFTIITTKNETIVYSTTLR